jgi:CHAT domain-containing protein
MVHAGLALAGANRRDEAVADGIVTAREIAGMNLLGTQLVVLSACQTGVGHIADGEEFTGLRRAFAIAGARSQLTSLWPVDDDATAALMTAFYERIRTGAPRGEALRAAEHAIRNREDRPEWTHPFYWVAFQQSGDWGAIAAAG